MPIQRRRLVVATSLVLATGLGAWGLVGAFGAPPAMDPSRLVPVERGTMVRSVVATGRVEPITKIEIKSKANGIIERLHADVDQMVDAGRVLAELDKENLTARVREARANLRAAQAAQEAASAQLDKNRIEAEAPDVSFAARNHQRAERLYAERLVSQSMLDEARNALDQAALRQRAAQGQLLVSRARVTESLAVIEQARAAVERAEEELANATIKAPIRGTVLTRDVEIGSPVSSILNLGANATLVMTLGDIAKVFVRGRVDETEIGRVRLGQAARITTESFRDKVFQGRVTQISPIGIEKDNVTTFEIRVSIDNTGHALRANMTANAEITFDEFPNALLIPEAAVIYDEKRNPFVDLVDRNERTGRRRVPVVLGVGNGSKIHVTKGVAAGDTVVLPG